MFYTAHKRSWVIGALCASVIVTVFVWVVISDRRASKSDGDTLPEIVLTPVGDGILFESRRVNKPDIFGTPLQALATLDEYETKLAIRFAGDDNIETAAASALYWSMTPEDVRLRKGDFVGVINQAEQLFESISAELSPGEPPAQALRVRLVAWLGVCIYIVATESPEYDSYIPRIAVLGKNIINRDIVSSDLMSQSAYLLYELDLRSWLDPEGKAALNTAYAKYPNFRVYFPNYHNETENDFLKR